MLRCNWVKCGREECGGSKGRGQGQSGSGWVKRLGSQRKREERNFRHSVCFRVLQKVSPKVIKLIMLERGTRGAEGKEMGMGRERR